MRQLIIWDSIAPQTTAITNKKTNLFLTLGREIRYLGLSWRCTKNFMCLNKTDNEIFAFCEDRWLRFSLNEMQWIFEPPIYSIGGDCPYQTMNSRLKFPALSPLNSTSPLTSSCSLNSSFFVYCIFISLFNYCSFFSSFSFFHFLHSSGFKAFFASLRAHLPF